jgi:hypothetical protein
MSTMSRDAIARIEIDAEGRLHVIPESASFPFIWREAMEVHWDEARQSLYAPPPRSWSRGRWLRQILDAAREQGWTLSVTGETAWAGVAPEEKAELLEASRTE